jgi:hypothetical protein
MFEAGCGRRKIGKAKTVAPQQECQPVSLANQTHRMTANGPFEIQSRFGEVQNPFANAVIVAVC